MMMGTRRPTILHLRGSDFFGSPERLIAGQMKHIDDFNCTCASFVKPGGESPFLSEMRRRGFVTFEIEDNGRYDPKVPARIRDLVRSNGIDMLVTHEYKSNFYGHRAVGKLSVPQIAYFHGWTRENLKVRFYNYIDERILKKLKRVITVSEYSARELSRSGVPEGRISVVYNAIEVANEIMPLKNERDMPVLGVVGRLSHEKGVHVLLEAVATIRQDAPGFRVEIFGTGPDEGKLLKQSARLGISDIVKFRGFRDNLDDIYGTIDILVLSSLSEGHPMVILEAWARGIGVIASRAGGIPEIIEDGKNGILAEVGIAEDLGRALLQGLKNQGMMNEYGHAGFNLVKEKYSFDKQASELSGLYAEALGASSA
jgi:glycosyltransferase involved in cell wall biosynthesis